VTAPSIDQWPELCTRGAISLATRNRQEIQYPQQPDRSPSRLAERRRLHLHVRHPYLLTMHPTEHRHIDDSLTVRALQQLHAYTELRPAPRIHP
jgi:hypothetical protein